MKLKLVLSLLLLFSAISMYSQYARFPISGIIEYEKRVNVHALLKKTFTTTESFESYIKSHAYFSPQFMVLKSTLTFSRDRLRFDPESTSEKVGSMSFVPEAEQVNSRYTDLNSQTFTSQKTVLGDIFLVRDSVREINWKLTSEMRTIVGFECRRANAIIMDSIYVVAYYTTQIPVSGGPESFSGLPGMILGIALPHEHVTWFATRVTDREIDRAEIKPPVKGKAADEVLLEEIVKKNLGDDKWGLMQRILKCIIL